MYKIQQTRAETCACGTFALAGDEHLDDDGEPVEGYDWAHSYQQCKRGTGRVVRPPVVGIGN